MPKYAQLLYVSPCPGKKGNKDSSWLDVAWGIPFSPEEFVQKALEAQRPRTLPALLPEALSVALKMVAQHTPAAIATHRARWFAKWIKVAESLKSEELALKASQRNSFFGRQSLRTRATATLML